MKKFATALLALRASRKTRQVTSGGRRRLAGTVLLGALTLLAGCGSSPEGTVIGLTRTQGGAQAENRQDMSLELKIPAEVMGYVDQHIEKIKAEYGKEYVKDMYGRPMYPKYKVVFDTISRNDLKVVVSRDGFKTRLEEAGMYRYRRFDGKNLLVPFNTSSGEVEYYLELHVSLFNTATDKLVKRLPVAYISNMGQNFKAPL